MIAAPWAALRISAWSPSVTTAAGTPSCAVATSAAGTRWRAQSGGEQVDGDVQPDERDGETQDRRVLDQRIELQAGAEDDEEQRDEEPVGEHREPA